MDTTPNTFKVQLEDAVIEFEEASDEAVLKAIELEVKGKLTERNELIKSFLVRTENLTFKGEEVTQENFRKMPYRVVSAITREWIKHAIAGDEPAEKNG